MAVRGPPSGAPGKDDLDPPLHVINCNLVCIPVTPCRSTPLIATPDVLPEGHSLPYGSGQLPDFDLTSGTRLRQLYPTRCLAGYPLRPKAAGRSRSPQVRISVGASPTDTHRRPRLSSTQALGHSAAQRPGLPTPLGVQARPGGCPSLGGGLSTRGPQQLPRRRCPHPFKGVVTPLEGVNIFRNLGDW